jgi:hypothetical protein
VFADDGAFAFGSRRDIELGAQILYDHCVGWGMMPHTAGKTVAMYFGQPVANLREFLPDEAIPPIKMGDGEAPVVPEFKRKRAPNARCGQRTFCLRKPTAHNPPRIAAAAAAAGALCAESLSA